MPYKYKFFAYSNPKKRGDINNECYYINNSTSLSGGKASFCTDTITCRDKKQFASVINAASNCEGIERTFTYNAMKAEPNRDRMKVIYFLKSLMNDIRNSDVYSREFSGSIASVLYCEGKNVYAAGIGTPNIYHYSSADSIVRKIVFPKSYKSENAASGSDGVKTHVKFIGRAKSGDEYLIVGNDVENVLGGDVIVKIFASGSSDLNEQLLFNVDKRSPHASVTFIHAVIKNSYLIYVKVLLIIALIAGGILFLFPDLLFL